MRLGVFAALAASIALAGCGAEVAALHGIPIVEPAEAAAVAANIKVEPNPHTGTTIVSGPIIFPERNILGNAYLVRSWIAPNNPALDGRFQIYVSVNRREWAFLDTAYANGQMLDTTRIDRSVGSCSSYGCRVTEVVGINLSRDEVTQLASTGLSFQIRGQRGSVEMSVPAAYFAAVLAAHDQAKASS